MTIQELKDKNLIIFEGMIGSHAHGTNTDKSDVDIKGIYMLPLEMHTGFDYVERIADEGNNNTYYELKRFFELLAVNNPDIMELMCLPDDCILYKDPIFDMVLENYQQFLSKLCENSYGEFAIGQIKKARGLNKKIVNPMDKIRKNIIDFCWVAKKQGSIPLTEWLEKNELLEEMCGLVAIDHMKNCYHLFSDHDNHEMDRHWKEIAERDNFYSIPDIDDHFYNKLSAENLAHMKEWYKTNKALYKGIQSKNGSQLVLSSVEKGIEPEVMIYCNIEGFSTYCKLYKEYWDWDAKKNQDRYNDNIASGKNYDGKNLAHCHRLLDMATEIGESKGINVRRLNRDYLLSIKKGVYEYDDIVTDAEAKIIKMKEVFANSTLPNKPDFEAIKQLLYAMQKKRYGMYSEEDMKNALREAWKIQSHLCSENKWLEEYNKIQ